MGENIDAYKVKVSTKCPLGFPLESKPYICIDKPNKSKEKTIKVFSFFLKE